MPLLRLLLLPLLATGAGAADLRIACIGDSITAGYGANQGEAYPAQLQGLFPTGAERVLNFGISGCTLAKRGDQPYWAQQVTPGLTLLQHAADRQPDIVLLMLGTNDAKPANHAATPDLTADYRALVEVLRGARSHPTVYALPPLPAFGDGNFAISPATLDTVIVPTVLKTAAELHLPVIDVRAAFRDHPELLPDRIHPNAAGYHLLAGTVAAALRSRPDFAVRGGEFIDRVEVALSAPAGTQIRYTLDGTLPTATAMLYSAPFSLEASATVTAAAFTNDTKSIGATSGLPATATFTKAVPRPAQQPAGTVPGLRCAVYEQQGNRNIWRMEWDETLLTRTIDVAGVDLTARPTGDGFALVFTGFIAIPATGVYTFTTTSDDGSTLAVAGEVVVENGDMHGPRERRGTIALAAGLHPFTLRYFNESRGCSLAATWEGPGLARQTLPAGAFRRPGASVGK